MSKGIDEIPIARIDPHRKSVNQTFSSSAHAVRPRCSEDITVLASGNTMGLGGRVTSEHAVAPRKVPFPHHGEVRGGLW